MKVAMHNPDPLALHSGFNGVLRRTPVLRRVYKAIEDLQEKLKGAEALSARLTGELAAARTQVMELGAREETVSSQLAKVSAELAVSLQKVATVKAELTASAEREAIAKAAVSAAVAHAEELFSLAHGPALRDQLAAHTDALLQRFSETQNSFSAQIPLLTSHLIALQASQRDGFKSLSKSLMSQNAVGGSMTSDLYLDLLEASLTGTIHPDASQAPWAKGVYDPALRAVGRDWPSQAETMIGTARMRNLRTLTQRALEEHVPGDLIETGVWRGGACIYMRGILAAAGDAKRRVFVADSFCGLPPPDEAVYPADAGDAHHTYPQLAVSRADVEANFQRYGLMDEQVIFLEGWFKDTLPTAPLDQLAILRLDGDMYESTMDALNALYAKVSPGGFVIVDDYVLNACKMAIDDFRSRHGISATMHEVDGAAVWWQVPS